jgi:hypothetical protein
MNGFFPRGGQYPRVEAPVSAPTARNVIAWAIGPGQNQLKPPSAESAKYVSRQSDDCCFLSTVSISRLQRFQNSFSFAPGALPQAVTFRAFGAKTSVFTSGRAEPSTALCMFDPPVTRAVMTSLLPPNLTTKTTKLS